MSNIDGEPQFGPPTPEDFKVEPECSLLDPNEQDIAKVDHIVDFANEVISDPDVVDPIEPMLLRNLVPLLKGKRGSLRGGELRPPLAHAFVLARLGLMGQPATTTIGIELRKLEGVVDKQLRALFPGEYPERGTEGSFYDENKATSQIDGEQLWWDMGLPLRYNDPESGYAVTTAIINNLPPSDKPRVIIDIGTAFGQGARKIKLYEKYPFKPRQTFVRIGNVIKPDIEMQYALDKSLQSPSPPSIVVGTDLIHPNEKEFELGSSQTFLMSRRLKEPEAVQEFSDLYYKEPVATEWTEGVPVIIPKRPIDATSPGFATELGQILPEGVKADVFVLSGVVLQFPHDKLKEIFSYYQAAANPGAIAIVSEWANATPDGLEILEGVHWHHENGFKTFVIDLSNLDRPPLEICRYTNRQAREVIFTPEGRQFIQTGKFE